MRFSDLRRSRLVELIVVVCLIACVIFGFSCFRSRTTSSESLVCLRWSSVGGCYSSSDFFFELREREDGSAEWRGLICQRGPTLFEEKEAGERGNYQAAGTISGKELQELVQRLEEAGVWKLDSAVTSTLPIQSVHLRIGGRLHEVSSYQFSFDGDTAVENQVNSVLYEGLPGKVADEFDRRVRSGASPDRPLLVPQFREIQSFGEQEQRASKALWPADEQSLFLLPW